ncbi:uncharacterized protein [Procambarus clarkii]|uniref:uncharacterized protein n=1 Tax=Procambarus clarkii TaxID=6728 RepID=UPI003743043C
MYLIYETTRLLSGAGAGPLEFAEPRYCAVMDEDAQIASPVVTVGATHKQGAEVRYSITGGNKDGLFTIDQRSGLITLAAALDYEIHDKHELVVAAESGGGEAVRAIVQVRVQDVNDNAPYFLHPDPIFTVIEEDDRDLPTTITTVRARDKDAQDKRGLLYTLRGDGVDGYTPADAFFAINPRTGELIQLRALDRDPPRGRQVWKVRVQVRDAQVHWMPERDDLFLQVLQGAQDHHLPQARVQRDIGGPSEGELSGIISERRGMEGDFDGLVAVKVSSGGKEMEDGKTSIEKITAVEHPAGQSAPQDSLGVMYSWDSRSDRWGLLTAGEKHRNGNWEKIGQYIGSKNTVPNIPLHIRKQNHEIFRNFPVSPEEGRGLGLILHRVSSSQKKQGRYKNLPPGPTDSVGERNVQYYHENTETKSSAESLTRVAKPSKRLLSGYNAKDNPHNLGQLANHENHPIDVRTTEPATSIASTDHIFNQQNLLIITNDNRVSLNKIPNINNGWKGRTLSSWRTTTAKRSLRQGQRSTPSFTSGSTISLNTTSTTKTSVSSESNAKEIEERNVVRKLNRIVTKSPNTQSTPVEDASDNIRIMDSFPTSAMNNLTLGIKTEPEYSEYSWLSHPEQKFSTSSWSSEPASGLKTPLSSFALQKFAHRTEMNIYHEETYRKTLAPRYRKVNGTFSPVSNQPESALSRQGNPRELHPTLLTKEKSIIVNDKSKRNSESIARLSRDALVGDDSRRRFVADSRSAIAQEFHSDSYHHGKSSRGPRGVFITPNDHYGMDDSGEGDGGGGGGGCEDVTVFGGELQNRNMTGGGRLGGDDGPGGRRRGGRVGRVHVVETVVTLLVKDINDNPPVFPNTTMFGEVQENGPIGAVFVAYLAGRRVTVAYLAGNRLSASYLAGYRVSARYLAGNRMSASYLAGYRLSASYLAGYRLSASYLAGYRVSARYLAGNRMSASYLAGYRVSARYLAGNRMSASYLAGYRLSASYLAGYRLSASYLAGYRVSARYLAGNRMSASYLAGYRVSARYLAGYRVSASYLAGYRVSASYLAGYRVSASYLAGYRVSASYLAGYLPPTPLEVSASHTAGGICLPHRWRYLPPTPLEVSASLTAGGICLPHRWRYLPPTPLEVSASHTAGGICLPHRWRYLPPTPLEVSASHTAGGICLPHRWRYLPPTPLEVSASHTAGGICLPHRWRYLPPTPLEVSASHTAGGICLPHRWRYLPPTPLEVSASHTAGGICLPHRWRYLPPTPLEVSASHTAGSICLPHRWRYLPPTPLEVSASLTAGGICLPHRWRYLPPTPLEVSASHTAGGICLPHRWRYLPPTPLEVSASLTAGGICLPHRWRYLPPSPLEVSASHTAGGICLPHRWRYLPPSPLEVSASHTAGGIYLPHRWRYLPPTPLEVSTSLTAGGICLPHRWRYLPPTPLEVSASLTAGGICLPHRWRYLPPSPLEVSASHTAGGICLPHRWRYLPPTPLEVSASLTAGGICLPHRWRYLPPTHRWRYLPPSPLEVSTSHTAGGIYLPHRWRYLPPTPLEVSASHTPLEVSTSHTAGGICLPHTAGGICLPHRWRYLPPTPLEVSASHTAGGIYLPHRWRYLPPTPLEVSTSHTAGGIYLPHRWRYLPPTPLEVSASHTPLEVSASHTAGGICLPHRWRYLPPTPLEVSASHTAGGICLPHRWRYLPPSPLEVSASLTAGGICLPHRWRYLPPTPLEVSASHTAGGICLPHRWRYLPPSPLEVSASLTAGGICLPHRWRYLPPSPLEVSASLTAGGICLPHRWRYLPPTPLEVSASHTPLEVSASHTAGGICLPHRWRYLPPSPLEVSASLTAGGICLPHRWRYLPPTPLEGIEEEKQKAGGKKWNSLEKNKRYCFKLWELAEDARASEDCEEGTDKVQTQEMEWEKPGGIQEVSYKVKGGWDALMVDAEGGVSLWRALDREAPDGAIGVAQIISVDRGMPPLSATATLTITVSDVNDCPPRLLPPTLLHVTEAGPPTLLGVLTATDHDVWALGHGPPFNLSLAPTNPAHVLSHVSLTFDSHLDSGRGGAELWTVRAVDREQHPQLLVEVWAADAQGLSVTHTVTVVIDDLNDNPMKPAAKTVYLWKTQGGGPDAPLGRVYVDDPDDWDLADKTFRWVGSPHPLFSLNPDDGTIFASSQVREGRYELQFGVSDRVWGQRGVAANVTVAVKVLTPDALAHAAPVTLTPTTPADLTRGWTPTEGGGRLGGVIEAIRRVVGESSHTVDVVSVYGHPHNPPPHTTSDTLQGDHTVVASSSFAPDGDREFDAGEFEGSWSRPSSCVWVSVREAGGGFMDPVKLQGLLALNTGQLEERTHLTVVAEDAAAGRVEPQDPLQDHALPPQEEQQQQPSLPSTLGFGIESEPSSAATRASTALPLQVVDTNVTSLVTPRLTRALACHAHEPESCTPISCLNGGGCLRTSSGNRCVCPQGSVGPRCKVLARTFSGAGWAWVRPLPPCLPLTISFRVLTRRSHALLLFSGPLAPHPRRPHSPPTPMLAVQLWEGRPQVVLEGGGSPLKLEVNTTVNDGDWHLLHLHLNAQGVSVMVDLCGRGWHDRSSHDSHCITRAEWVLPTGGEAWAGSPPLQVGGLAHAPPRPDDHGWVEAPTARPLEGCVSHLTLNGQLVDLGEPAYSQGSVGGCHPQDAACPGGLGGCGRRGQCVGGLLHPQCECDPGWSGLGCATPTTPAALGKSSYMKVALSFTPAPRVVTVQLRVRTRGPRNGLLLRLAAHHRSAAFTLHLRAGVACVSVSGAGWATRAACVEGRPVGDGAWHTIVAERHGHNLAVSVDDGDGWRRNESLVSLLQGPGARGVRVSPGPLEVDKHDGVTVGGMPEFAGVSLVTVHEDLSDSCIDDLRVSGRPLPLPPAVNGTSWGQVTTSERFTRGCPAPDACVNTTCAPPLSCTSTWGRATCSCGAGGQLVDDTVCEDVDECLWRPCLHGGSCYNLRPGYLCVCGPGRTGDNCEWGGLSPDSHPFTAPVAIAALTLSLFLLVVVGVVFSIRLHRQWLGRALAGRQVGDVGGVGGVGGEEGTIIAVKGGMEEDSGSIRLKEDPDDTFLNCLKYNHLQAHPPTQRKAEESPARPESSSHHTLVKEPSAADVSARVRAADAAPEPLLPQDDLRAYAYEGDGSSAGSLSSAISGLKAELDDDGNMKPLVSEFLEVMDLLRNLPEASKSPSLLTKLDRKSGLQGSGTPGGPDVPPTPRSSIKSSTPTACGASPAHRRETRHTPPRHASSPRSKEELSTAC